jgi:hypothetical protein
MLTTFAAFIGATSGVISLWWLLRNWSLDRADVRLRVAVSSRFVPAWEQSPSSGARMLGGATKRILTITLVNHGRRDAQVDSITADLSDRTELPCTDPAQRTIVKAEMSEAIELPLDVLASEEPVVIALFARGALGQRWELHHTDFVDVQATARRLLADARREARERQLKEARSGPLGDEARAAAALKGGK